jgi:hypothetical protein
MPFITVDVIQISDEEATLLQESSLDSPNAGLSDHTQLSDHCLRQHLDLKF